MTGGRSGHRQVTGGYTMVEVLVALALLAIVGSGLIGAITALLRVGEITEDQTMALAVARHQLEQVARVPYDATPTAYLTAIPAGVTYAGRQYAAPVYATPGPTPGLQRIVVPVSFDGRAILTLEDVKVNRNAPTPAPTPGG